MNDNNVINKVCFNLDKSLEKNKIKFINDNDINGNIDSESESESDNSIDEFEEQLMYMDNNDVEYL